MLQLINGLKGKKEMLNAHDDIVAIVNRLITSTNLSAKDVGTVLNDAVFNAVGTARRYEQCPFVCPDGMSDKMYREIGALYAEARDLYEHKHGDVFAFMRLVDAAGFKPTDSYTIMVEKIRKFFDEIQETTTSWMDHIPLLLGSKRRWAYRLEAILDGTSDTKNVTEIHTAG